MANDNHGSHAADLPAGWVWTTIGEVADTSRRRMLPQERPDLQFIGMENIEAHTMRLLGTVPASEMKSSAEHFEPGDVMYGRLRPYLNKVYCPKFEGLCSSEFIVFRKTDHLKSEYLQYFLNSWDFVTFASHLNTGDRPRVNFDQLANYPLPLAPLPEQHRIVAKIEEQFTRLDAGVAALKRVQANLKRYKASVLKAACEGRLVAQEASDEPASELLKRILAERRAKWSADLRAKGKDPQKAKYDEPQAPDIDALAELPQGWCWAKVDQIASKVTDGVHQTPRYVDDGIPFISVNNISEDGLISFDPCKFITPEAHKALYTRCNPRKGDVLLTKVGTIGLTAVIRTDREFSLYVNTALIRPVAEVISAAYMAVALRYGFLSKFYESFVSGSNQKFIGTTKIAELPVPLPPLAEQRRIVAEVERRLSVVQELDAALTANLARAERLRQSILKRAFEGKL